jgi:hypothetical protein
MVFSTQAGSCRPTVLERERPLDVLDDRACRAVNWPTDVAAGHRVVGAAVNGPRTKPRSARADLQDTLATPRRC